MDGQSAGLYTNILEDLKVVIKKLASLAVVRRMETLLTRSGSFCIHVRNLQKLMTEIYKSSNHLNRSLLWEFHEKSM